MLLIPQQHFYTETMAQDQQSLTPFTPSPFSLPFPNPPHYPGQVRGSSSISDMYLFTKVEWCENVVETPFRYHKACDVSYNVE